MILANDILILMPAFNEAETIGTVVMDLKEQGYQNILVVNDGSSDKTKQICIDLGVKIISHKINRGAGAAVQTGLEYTRKTAFKYLIIMDADGQHKGEDVDVLSDAMSKKNADIVIGNRFGHPSNTIPRMRRFYNRIANVITNIPNKKNYKDTQSGFRLLNRNCIEKMNLQIDGYGFCSEMIWKAEAMDCNIVEVPIQVLYSEYSMNKGQNFSKGIKTAFSLLFQRIF